MTFEKKSGKPEAVGGVKEASPPKITRRRFTKASVVAPVVMTLGSRPVWGMTECAASISGQQSGNGYMHYDAPGTQGYPPAWWLLSLERWPSVYLSLIAEDDEAANITIPGDSGQADVKLYTAYRSASAQSAFPCESEVVSLYEMLEGADSEAAAAILNATQFDYGYMPESVASFVCGGHSEDVTCVLEGLNRRYDGNSTELPTLPAEKDGVTFSYKGTKYTVQVAYVSDGRLYLECQPE